MADIRDYHQVREAAAGVEYIIHLAAIPSVTRSIHDPLTTNEVNVQGTLNVLHAAKEAKVKSPKIFGIPARDRFEGRPSTDCGLV